MSEQWFDKGFKPSLKSCVTSHLRPAVEIRNLVDELEIPDTGRPVPLPIQRRGAVWMSERPDLEQIPVVLVTADLNRSIKQTGMWLYGFAQQGIHKLPTNEREQLLVEVCEFSADDATTALYGITQFLTGVPSIP